MTYAYPTYNLQRLMKFSRFFLALVLLRISVPALALPDEPHTGTIVTPTIPLQMAGKLGSPASEVYADDVIKVGPDSRRVAVVLELTTEPAALVFARAQLSPLSRVEQIEAIAAITRAQLATIEHEQQGVLALLPSTATVLYRNQRVYNGIAAMVDPTTLDAIAQIPGVMAVRKLIPKSISNTTTVPLIRAPEAWSAPGGLTGSGVSIGIIDSGVDYLHADFGGLGAITPSLYLSNNTTIVTDSTGFPNAKVVGGWDFVGDDYNADGFGTSSIPVPDPDPMDCAGHGSHVAGTAAGLGVLQSALTYTGAYTSGVPFDQFRIGPGVAPGARIYALKIFGCFGTTNMADAALEWAVDPNGDGDFSDRLDVVNLSLGSSYGSADDPTAIAANNASIAGVVVVASAGNSGDTNFVLGAPATADRAIAVAAVQDATDVMDGLQITGSQQLTNGIYSALQSVFYSYQYPTSTVAATLAIPISSTSGCSHFSITDTQVISGHIAFLDWTHVDGDNECGSATRVGNAVSAHAIGVVLAHDLPRLDVTLGGTNQIPSVIVPKGTGDALRFALEAGDVVTAVLSPLFNDTQIYIDNTRTNASAAFSSRGVRLGDFVLKPDLAAPGQTVFSVKAGSGNKGLSQNGTSMAAPHVSGEMAILKQLHPFWSPEELKALAMNTSDVSVSYEPNVTMTVAGAGMSHSPARMGAGRIDVGAAVASNVVAYSDAGLGQVSLNFGAIEALDPMTLTRVLRIDNKGTRTIKLTLAYSNSNSVPGTSIVLSPSVVTLGPVSGAKIQVVLHIEPAMLQHVKDATLEPVQSGFAREWLSEENGLIMLMPDASQPPLRVPLYATVRPASAMSSTGFTRGQTSIQLNGRQVDGPGVISAREISQLSVLELQYQQSGPTTKGINKNAEIRAVGVNSDFVVAHGILSTTVYFGVATKGDWSTPTSQDVEFDVFIDTNRDGTADYVLFNYNQGNASGKTEPNDVFVGALLKLNTFGRTVQPFTNGVSPDSLHVPLFHNSVMMLPVRASDLKLVAGQAFDWQIITYARGTSTPIDQSPVLRYSPIAPVFEVTHGDGSPPIWRDAPGQSIAVRMANPAAFTRRGEPGSTHGLLLLHHFNEPGSRAEVLEVIPSSYYFPMVRKT